MKLPEKISIGLIILSFIASFIAYSHLPFQIATHWNLKGEADGFMLKHFGTYLIPTISLLIFLLLLFFIRADPLIRGTKKFKIYPEWIFVMIVGFLTYLQALLLLFNLGVAFNFTIKIIYGLALLFFFLGFLIEHTPRNYTVGIRTPWTLAEDFVWQKTHKLGGKLFKILGIIILFGSLFPPYSAVILLVAIICVVAFLFVYSYLVHRSMKRR